MRLRKSIKVGPARINLSKSGVGYSVGAGGVRVGRNAKGKNYTSVRTPLGTSVRTSGGRPRSGGGTRASGAPAAVQEPTTPKPSNPVVWLAVGAVLSVAAPVCGVPVLLIGIGIFIAQKTDPASKAGRLVWQADQKLRASPAEYDHALLEEAVSLKPGVPLEGVRHRVLQLARQLVDADRMDTARKVLARYAEVDEHPAVAGAAAGLLADAGEYDDALDLFERARENPAAADAYAIPHAATLTEAGRPKEAIRLLQGHVPREGLEVAALNALATAMRADGQPEAAIEVLRDAPLRKRNLDDDLKLTHAMLGALYRETGDKRRAVQHLRRVYAVDAGFRDVADQLEALTGDSTGGPE